MYTKMSEALILDSRDKIRFSMLSLMAHRPYSDITIAEICHAAKVSRQTFYRLFSTKDGVLTFHLHQVMGDYIAQKIFMGDQFESELSRFFLFFMRYQDLLELLYRNDKMHLLQRVLVRHSDSFIHELFFFVGSGHVYATEFVAATLCSVLTVWTKMEFKTSCSTLVTYASEFFANVG